MNQNSKIARSYKRCTAELLANTRIIHDDVRYEPPPQFPLAIHPDEDTEKRSILGEYKVIQSHTPRKLWESLIVRTDSTHCQLYLIAHMAVAGGNIWGFFCGLIRLPTKAPI